MNLNHLLKYKKFIQVSLITLHILLTLYWQTLNSVLHSLFQACNVLMACRVTLYTAAIFHFMNIPVESLKHVKLSQRVFINKFMLYLPDESKHRFEFVPAASETLLNRAS